MTQLRYKERERESEKEQTYISRMAESNPTTLPTETSSPPPSDQTIINSDVNDSVITANHTVKHISADTNSEKSSDVQCKAGTNNDTDNGARDIIPLLTHPTYEHLYDNYTKVQLQDHCRNRGMHGIWTTKDKLIEKILSSVESNAAPQCSAVEFNTTSTQGFRGEQDKDDSATLLDVIAEKNKKIEQLYVKMDEQNSYLLRLHERLATLEATTNAEHRPESPASHQIAPPDLPQPLPTSQEENRRLSNTTTQVPVVRFVSYFKPPPHNHPPSGVIPQEITPTPIPLSPTPPLLMSTAESTPASPSARPNDSPTPPTHCSLGSSNHPSPTPPF